MKGCLVSACGMFFTFMLQAAQYDLPREGRVIGELLSVTAEKGDTLNRLAIRYGVGYNEMRQANPQWQGKRIPVGSVLTLPTQYKLPKVVREGIIINLADMRLFYYPPSGDKVFTFPVAVGKRGWGTPKGRTNIVAKIKHPTWTPTKSIRREAARKGKKLRKIYPAGPKNPLGTRALRLGISGYLIHGTNRPGSIGKRVSHGCIRLRRSDIEALYSMVSVNTPVTIVSDGKVLASPQRYKNSKSQKQSRKWGKNQKNSTVTKQHKPYTDNRVHHRSHSYVTSDGLDYNRLQRDIEVGNARPIDLSGL